jgi:hypothetical protein
MKKASTNRPDSKKDSGAREKKLGEKIGPMKKESETRLGNADHNHQQEPEKANDDDSGISKLFTGY